MKLAKYKKVLLILSAPLMLSVLTGCGKSDSNEVPPPTAPIGTGPGAVMPPIGGPGGGFLPPPPPGIPIPGGCVPINGPITFTASNAYADWANIVAGTIPRSGRQVGTVQVGTGGGGGPYQRNGVDGNISMNISVGGAFASGYTPYPGFNQNFYPGNYGYNSYQGGGNGFGFPGGGQDIQVPSTVQISGLVQISARTMQDIQYQFGGGYQNMWGGANAYNNPYGIPGSFPGSIYPQQFPQNTMYPAGNICVSGLALDVGHYGTTIYGGNVYIYLNGGNTGYVLYF